MLSHQAGWLLEPGSAEGEVPLPGHKHTAPLGGASADHCVACCSGGLCVSRRGKVVSVGGEAVATRPVKPLPLQVDVTELEGGARVLLTDLDLPEGVVIAETVRGLCAWQGVTSL